MRSVLHIERALYLITLYCSELYTILVVTRLWPGGHVVTPAQCWPVLHVTILLTACCELALLSRWGVMRGVGGQGGFSGRVWCLFGAWGVDKVLSVWYILHSI